MPDTEALRAYPSILFGLETAFRHFQTGNFALWDTDFSRGKAGIPINGLIWMGDYKKDAGTNRGQNAIKAFAVLS